MKIELGRQHSPFRPARLAGYCAVCSDLAPICAQRDSLARTIALRMPASGGLHGDELGSFGSQSIFSFFAHVAGLQSAQNVLGPGVLRIEQTRVAVNPRVEPDVIFYRRRRLERVPALASFSVEPGYERSIQTAFPEVSDTLSARLPLDLSPLPTFASLIGEQVVIPAQSRGATFSSSATAGTLMAKFSETTMLFE